MMQTIVCMSFRDYYCTSTP